MPFTKEMLDELEGKVHFCEEPGEVEVYVGSNGVRSYTEPKIAVDGRRYEAAGTIILKSGHYMRANLSLDTRTSNLLQPDRTYCKVGTTWYRIDEPQLLEALHVDVEEAFPCTWIPDRPLDCRNPPSYSMGGRPSLWKTIRRYLKNRFAKHDRQSR